jgi:hypothetical protein
VTVNAIAPGYLVTTFTEAHRDDPHSYAAMTARIPAGRWGQPADLAGAAVFLAARASAYVTGTTLVVDGGMARPLRSAVRSRRCSTRAVPPHRRPGLNPPRHLPQRVERRLRLHDRGYGRSGTSLATCAGEIVTSASRSCGHPVPPTRTCRSFTMP